MSQKQKRKNQVRSVTIIFWLTLYNKEVLEKRITKRIDFEIFFADAPALCINISKIKGLIYGCHVKVFKTN